MRQVALVIKVLATGVVFALFISGAPAVVAGEPLTVSAGNGVLIEIDERHPVYDDIESTPGVVDFEGIYTYGDDLSIVPADVDPVLPDYHYESHEEWELRMLPITNTEAFEAGYETFGTLYPIPAVITEQANADGFPGMIMQVAVVSDVIPVAGRLWLGDLAAGAEVLLQGVKYPENAGQAEEIDYSRESTGPAECLVEGVAMQGWDVLGWIPCYWLTLGD